jgi:hypothetical protein
MNNKRNAETGRAAIDPIFKQMMTEMFQGPGINIQTEVEVARLPLRIDVIIRIATQEALRAIQALTPFWFFLIHNILEFKGPGDALTINGYNRILGRARLYLSKPDVSESELTLTLICAQTPRKILSHPKIGFERIREGYYFSDHRGLNVYLIAINELPTVPVNYSLLLFASSKVKRQEIIKEIVINELAEYIAYAYRIDPELTKEISNMADKYTRNLQYIARTMWPDLLPYISIEDRIRDLSDEDRRVLLQLWADQERLTPAQRLQGLSLEDIRDGLSDEEREALRQLLDGQERNT